MTQEPASHDEKSEYITTWKIVFAALLGWSETQIMDWVAVHQYGEYLDQPDDIMYHASPIYWAAIPIAQETFKDQITGLDLVDLSKRIVQVFQDVVGSEYDVPTKEHIASLQFKMKTLFTTYREFLANQQKDID
jgi:hypothetical protein